jgi:membrane protein
MRPMRDFAANLRLLLAAMVRQAGELRLQQTASSLTLLTLMAVVPMAAVGLLVFTALPSFGRMREEVQRFLAENLFHPSFSATVSEYLEQFVAAADQLSAIGTVLFLATAMTAMLTIDRTMNGIWGTAKPRPLAFRLALYWSLLSVGPVLLGAALALRARVAHHLPGQDGLELVAPLLPSILVVLVLGLLYRFAPNVRVRVSHAVLGAVLAALLLESLKWLLAVYVARFGGYTVVYGAFAALPLLLVWLVAAWMSVLVGALLAANLRHWGVPFGAPGAATPSSEFDRMVRVLREIVRSAPQRVPSARFRADFDGDARAAERTATQLSAQGYLVRVWPVGGDGGPAGVWDELWLPSAGLPGMTLRPLFDRVWRGEPRRLARAPQSASEVAADPGGEFLRRPIGEVLGTA